MHTKKAPTVLMGAMIAAGLAAEAKAHGLFVAGVTPYNELANTADGGKKHSGTAICGKEAHSFESKFDEKKGTVKLTINGQSITADSIDAEVLVLQLAGKLVDFNMRRHGAATKP